MTTLLVSHIKNLIPIFLQVVAAILLNTKKSAQKSCIINF